MRYIIILHFGLYDTQYTYTNVKCRKYWKHHINGKIVTRLVALKYTHTYRSAYSVHTFKICVYESVDKNWWCKKLFHIGYSGIFNIAVAAV